MSFKSKFLNVITFGHIKRKAKKEALKLADTKNEELTLNTVALPDISILVHSLGGMSNVHSISNTISTVTFKIEDFNKVDIDHLKKLSVKGVVKSAENITLIIGDCAAELKAKLDEEKNKLE